MGSKRIKKTCHKTKHRIARISTSSSGILLDICLYTNGWANYRF